MASVYPKASLPVDGRDLYNAILTDTPALQNAGMPFAATASTEGVDQPSTYFGQLFYNSIDLSNTFIKSLLNQVALTVLQSKYWSDPWVGLEKGKFDYGDVAQEVFINLSKPHDYDPKKAEEEVFKRDLPDVLTAFHTINYQKFYKKSISNEDLRKAFRSWQALVDFVSAIIQSMFTSMNYDVNQVKRYLVARGVLTGFIHMEKLEGPITDKVSAENATAMARAASMDMLEMSTNFNYYKVPNFTNFENQVIIINNKAGAKIDVSVLAADFNMDKAEFLTMHRLYVSSFANLDTKRLGELFKNDPSYVEIGQDDLNTLDSVPFIIFDRSWFQIYDYLQVITNIYNNDGLYWNYDLHVWKMFGVSPFSNAVGFTTEEQSVISVTVNPSAATVTAGQQVKLTPNVTTTGFVSQLVDWSSDTEGVTVNSNGVVSVSGTVASGTEVTITATSRYEPTKSATATITVG